MFEISTRGNPAHPLDGIVLSSLDLKNYIQERVVKITYPGYTKIFKIFKKMSNKIEIFKSFLDYVEYVFSIFVIFGYEILQLRSKMKPTNLMYPGFTHRV